MGLVARPYGLTFTNMETAPIRVLLYEDNAPLRTGLAALIGTAPDLHLTAALGHCGQAEADVRQLRPDVVLMDIDLPGRTGIEAVRGLKAAGTAAPAVLMLTVFDDSDRIFRALQAGADGYLLKRAAPVAILVAIREVRTGGAPLTPSVARQVLGFFGGAGGAGTSGGGPHAPTGPAEAAAVASLTAREQQVLGLLVEGFSYKMIAAELAVSLETVRSHIKHTYEKLHVRSGTEAVSKALRQGWA